METHYFWAFFIIALLVGAAIGFTISNATMTGHAFGDWPQWPPGWAWEQETTYTPLSLDQSRWGIDEDKLINPLEPPAPIGGTGTTETSGMNVPGCGAYTCMPEERLNTILGILGCYVKCENDTDVKYCVDNCAGEKGKVFVEDISECFSLAVDPKLMQQCIAGFAYNGHWEPLFK